MKKKRKNQDKTSKDEEKGKEKAEADENKEDDDERANKEKDDKVSSYAYVPFAAVITEFQVRSAQSQVKRHHQLLMTYHASTHFKSTPKIYWQRGQAFPMFWSNTNQDILSEETRPKAKCGDGQKKPRAPEKPHVLSVGSHCKSQVM